MTPDGKQKGWLEHPTSWPRPATPTALVPMWAGEFRDFNDWVSFAGKRLTGCYGEFGQEVTAICVDAIGRRCSIGGDFMRARDEGTFPVRYFWQCELPVDVTAVAGENDRERLARFFREERPDLGFEGDVEGWSPVESAMAFLRRAHRPTLSSEGSGMTSIDKAREALVDRLRYRIGNPSAWETYDDGASELMREALAAIQSLPSPASGFAAAIEAAARVADDVRANVLSLMTAPENVTDVRVAVEMAATRIAEAIRALTPATDDRTTAKSDAMREALFSMIADALKAEDVFDGDTTGMTHHVELTIHGSDLDALAALAGVKARYGESALDAIFREINDEPVNVARADLSGDPS